MTARNAAARLLALTMLLAIAVGAAHADPPHLVVDLNVAGTSSEPRGLTNVADKVFFTAFDADGAVGLWVTDGNAGGTVRLMDVTPATYSFNGCELTAVGDTLFFLNKGPTNIELWKSDGTVDGTVRVATTPDVGSGSVNLLRDVAGTLFFFAFDPAGGFELWTSDGSESGTVQVTDFGATEGVYYNELLVVGTEVFFTAYEATTGVELWKSDGTPAGTMLVRDINPGTESSYPGKPIAMNGFVYFTAREPTGGIELWRTDGSAAGTARVYDAVPGPDSAYVSTIGAVNGRLLFNAYVNSTHTVWATDGTAAGTGQIAASLNAADGCLVNATLYFGAYDPTAGSELWKSDGTGAGTVRVADIWPGSNGSGPIDLTALGNAVIFSAFDPTFGTELWKSDGTAAGTVRVADIFQGLGGSEPRFFVPLGDDLLFAAGGPGLPYERELWRTDGTTAGTAIVLDVAPAGSASSELSGFVADGADLAFVRNGTEMWSSDGTASGTLQIGTHYAAAIVVLDGTEYSVGDGLWKRSGHSSVKIADGYLGNLTVADGALFYTDGNQVFRSEGVAGDAVELVAITGPLACGVHACFNMPSNPRSFTAVGSHVFFIAIGEAGFELWRTDGTPTGTTQLGVFGLPHNVDPISSPYPLVAVNGALYFAARPSDPSNTNGLELWQSDGTVAGTTPVADINPGAADADPTELIDFGGTLVFAATDPTGGRELWQSDGSAGGTMPIAAINPGAADADPTNVIVHAGKLFFAATEPSGGRELWTSDGTAGGTQAVADIEPGPAGSDPTELVGAGGSVFFAASDAMNGRELWSTDGTAAGTSLVVDINPGAASSNPAELTATDGRLFFTAFTPATGTELWALGAAALPRCALPLPGGIAACSPGAADADGDGICDAADPCTNTAALTITGAKLKLAKLGGASDDEMLTAQGVLAVPTTPPIDLAGKGSRIRITGASGATIADATFAAGPYDATTRTGWTIRSAGTASAYQCDNSVVKLKITEKPLGSGLLRFKLIAKRRRLSVPLSELPLTVAVVVDAPTAETNQCAELAFPGASCKANATGTTIVCR